MLQRVLVCLFLSVPVTLSLAKSAVQADDSALKASATQVGGGKSNPRDLLTLTVQNLRL